MNDRDLQAVIEACARHAWENERRVKELKQHGITSEVELHQHIEKTIDDEDTRAFRGQTQANQGHSDGREMYGGLQHYSEERGKEYLTIVILNSNRDDEG